MTQRREIEVSIGWFSPQTEDVGMVAVFILRARERVAGEGVVAGAFAKLKAVPMRLEKLAGKMAFSETRWRRDRKKDHVLLIGACSADFRRPLALSTEIRLSNRGAGIASVACTDMVPSLCDPEEIFENVSFSHTRRADRSPDQVNAEEQRERKILIFSDAA